MKDSNNKSRYFGIQPDSATLKKWENMTDRNLHSEVLVEIATWFVNNGGEEKANDLLKALKFIMSEHERIGHMPSALYTVRDVLSAHMRLLMESVYGKVVVRKIYQTI